MLLYTLLQHTVVCIHVHDNTIIIANIISYIISHIIISHRFYFCCALQMVMLKEPYLGMFMVNEMDTSNATLYIPPPPPPPPQTLSSTIKCKIYSLPPSPPLPNYDIPSKIKCTTYTPPPPPPKTLSSTVKCTRHLPSPPPPKYHLPSKVKCPTHLLPPPPPMYHLPSKIKCTTYSTPSSHSLPSQQESEIEIDLLPEQSTKPCKVLLSLATAFNTFLTNILLLVIIYISFHNGL